jgi:hypothetical protein
MLWPNSEVGGVARVERVARIAVLALWASVVFAPKQEFPQSKYLTIEGLVAVLANRGRRRPRAF